MGRDIYVFIERRKSNQKWECVADDDKLMESYFFYRSPTLFALLSYNKYKGKHGVYQKPLKSWVSTLAPETNRHMFMRLETPINNNQILFRKDELDYSSLIKSLDDETEESEYALRWIDKGVSFLLTDDVVSNPDACYWNWCSADELEWAVVGRYEEDGCTIMENDSYLGIVKLMRRHENEGYDVRMVYCYDNTEPWLNSTRDTPKDKWKPRFYL